MLHIYNFTTLCNTIRCGKCFNYNKTTLSRYNNVLAKWDDVINNLQRRQTTHKTLRNASIRWIVKQGLTCLKAGRRDTLIFSSHIHYPAHRGTKLHSKISIEEICKPHSVYGVNKALFGKFYRVFNKKAEL